MRRAPGLPVLAPLFLLLACGGGSGGGGGGGGPTEPRGPSLTFFADGGGSNSVALSRGGASTGSTLVLDVVATEVVGLYGVAFDLIYPADVLSFEGAVEGNFLAVGASGTSLQLAETPPGNLIVGLSRLGPVAGRSGSGTLLTLEFSAVADGSGPFTFDRTAALDADGGQIAGVRWAAGSVQVTL